MNDTLDAKRRVQKTEKLFVSQKKIWVKVVANWEGLLAESALWSAHLEVHRAPIPLNLIEMTSET